ncbi:AprI/Inh family metalloprotease inhibitor [Devosia sp.]|uniref:AprI/Inh family metalloprotease inhibitor n=1 Tax=Devosia sp. TaxID=1871048 RepID=UPI003BA98EF7
MMNVRRASVSVAVIATLALAGCASSGVTTRNIATIEDITPIQNTPVASSNLPALGNSSTVQTADNNSLTQLSQPTPLDPSAPAAPQTASNDGSFVTLGSVGSVPDVPGRDLTSGLTIEKLLGGWTVVAGADQCKLNLTYTAKTGTSRYRASTPGCTLQGLNVVASWQLVGTQVQLFDEAGDIIASLILSGNHFIGTLAGGQGISMVG